MQPHHPSPARLGISSSPSHAPTTNTPTPNPTAASAAPQPNPNAAASKPPAPTTTSPGLLPLLPPLPRAQSLLHLMSSLATKLFDVSPHRAAWVSSYRGLLPNFLPSSSSSSPPLPPPPAVSSTKDVLAVSTSLQAQLFESVTELQEILDLQDSRARLARETRAKDAALLAFAKKVREAHQVLDRLVDDYADYRRAPKRARRSTDSEPVSEGDYKASLHSALDLDDILTYAHRISYTTFAPPEHGAGLPLRGALPPAPQENEMRASQLYQFADLDVGMPKKPLEAKERSAADAFTEPLMEPTPPREEAPLPIPKLPITVPPGWRKGMPIELPSDLPLPPPGWKPGDPITLPANATLGRAEEQRPPAAAVPQAVPPKGPEPIQVKHVQLDIDEDYSSDYSSEVGSSEEDDEE